MFVSWIILVESTGPFFERGDYLRCFMPAQFNLGEFARAVLGLFQQIQQGRNWLAMNLFRFEQWPAGIGNPVNAAVLLITIWIAQMMLHVPDKRLVPITKIKRPVRTNTDRRR